MTRKESACRRDIVLKAGREGKSWKECAELSGYSVAYVRQLLKRHGIVDRSAEIEATTDRVIALLKSGYTTEEVANIVGLSSTWVYKIARKNDISPETEVKRDRDMLIAFVQQYKSRGMTAQEISEKFGVNFSFVQKYTKGINPQTVRPLSEREEEAQRYIANHFDGIEYAGGYVHSDSPVMVRCLKCGTVFERSMITLRHQTSVTCPACVEEIRREQNETKKRNRQEELRVKREKKAQEKAERKREEAERKKAEKLHPCPVCGEITDRPKYCSDNCAQKVHNKNHETRRRAKIKSVLVDSDITVERLYTRDRGVCWICGEGCDWDDKETREDGTVVCGNRYPSIDHVISLAKGGEHKWSNVALAHRGCNSRRGVG